MRVNSNEDFIITPDMERIYRTKIISFFKTLSFRKALYPALTLFFALTVLALFILSARFLSRSIERVFVQEGEIEQNLTRVDMDTYMLLAKKLGIPIRETPATPTPTPVPENTPTPQESTGTSAPESTDENLPSKEEVSIAVYNGTQVAGAAGKIKTELETAGFSVGETGNRTREQEATELKFKESAQGFADEIERIAAARHAPVVRGALSAEDPFDIIIIIGAP